MWNCRELTVLTRRLAAENCSSPCNSWVASLATTKPLSGWLLGVLWGFHSGHYWIRIVSIIAGRCWQCNRLCRSTNFFFPGSRIDTSERGPTFWETKRRDGRPFVAYTTMKSYFPSNRTSKIHRTVTRKRPNPQEGVLFGTKWTHPVIREISPQ